MPTLHIHEPGKPAYTVAFDDDVLTLGSADNNHVILSDPTVDTNHCAIQRGQNGTRTLVDLESDGGTRLNGAAVKNADLKDRDEFVIGRTRIAYEKAGAPESTIPSPRRRYFRRRRGSTLRRRRVVLPKRSARDDAITYEDLKVAVEALLEDHGERALDDIAKILDDYFEDYRGVGPVAYLRSELDALYRILEINRAITGEHDPEKLLEMILDGMISITNAERGFLILKEGDRIDIRTARNIDQEDIKKAEFKISRTVADRVIGSGEPLISMDALNDPEIEASRSVEELQLRSVACVPLRTPAREGRARETIGCIYIDNRFETAVFSPADLPLLEAFTEQAVIALENARLWQDNLRKQGELKHSKQEVDRLNQLLKGRMEAQFSEYRKIAGELSAVRPTKYDYRSIVGATPRMREVFHLLDRVIESDESVFVYGESGTGKELVARAIHYQGKRREKPFVSENCSAIPETLIESELFGHEKGSFTGATATKKGLFELAGGGTLFLDEIGDMPVEMQKKVLRAIQEGVIRRVGGEQPIRVDVRLISASNKDLKELVKQRQFREDLFYRLNVVQIDLPPLRDRRDDVPVLVDRFLDALAEERKTPRRRMEEGTLQALRAYDWPGNVRELENEIRRAVALSDDVITVDMLKDEIRARDIVMPAKPIGPDSPLKAIVERAVEDVERRVVGQVLDETGWVKIEAARILGVSRPTLDSKIEKYGLRKS